MGIRFYCPECGRRLNVKSFLAGKRGICPHCDGRCEIPLESQLPTDAPRQRSVEEMDAIRQVAAAGNDQRRAPGAPAPGPTPRSGAATAAADPLAAAPAALWYVQPPGGDRFGPASGDVMRTWLSEGRVSPDCYVWCEGWPDWKTASDVFGPSQLAAAGREQVASSPGRAAQAPGRRGGETVSAAEGGNREDLWEQASPRAAASPTPAPAAIPPRPTARRSASRSVLPLIVLGLLILALLVVTVVVVSRSSADRPGESSDRTTHRETS